MVRNSSRDVISRASRALAFLLPTRTFTAANQRPLISFTFDDIDDSAATSGARILDSHAVRGTFYVAAGLCGATYAPWRFAAIERILDLHKSGHEIGCHTFSHADLQSLKHDQIVREIRANREYFEMLDQRIRLNNFAYPYGSIGLPQKPIVQSRFHSCRGIRPGINARNIDLGQLRAVRLYDSTLDPRSIKKLIDINCRTNGWLIFYTHDVTDSPSDQGCSPSLLEAAVQMGRQASCTCVPIRDALIEIGYRPHTAPN